MPESKPLPQQEEANLRDEPLTLPGDSFRDALALTMVKETFGRYEGYRSTNHDRRWIEHDKLFTGSVPQKTWPGTNIPRASLPLFTTFDHIETALPAIKEALFGSSVEWFQVEPEPGATPKEASAIRDKLLYDFDMASGKPEVGLAAKSVLTYGNGVMEVFWEEEKKSTVWRWVDLRDVYFDPATPTCNLDESRSLIRRKMMTVAELESLRGVSGMKLPERAVLVNMSENPMIAYADSTKSSSESVRGVVYSPSQWADLPLPSDKKIEVLIYYDPSKIIWVLNRAKVVYNEKNPYGLIPYAIAPCFTYLGRLYAMSYSDVLEPNQRYGEGLRNGRLDELTLALHPPRVSKLGANITPSANTWRPGMNFQYEDPKEVQLLQPSPSTTNISEELALLDISSEKHTGVNSVGMGVPRGGNANRTMGGMQMQVAGGASRISEIVKNIEDYLLVPLLSKAYRILQVHLRPEDIVSVMGPDATAIQVTGTDVKAPVRFKMISASRMLTRDKVAQVFPFVAQFLLQGPLVEKLQSQGQTVDAEELFRMLQDATGTAKAYRLVRPMNQQEQAAMNQPPPEAMMEMQKAQLDAQTRLQMGQMKAQGEAQSLELERDKMDEEASREMMLALLSQRGEAAKIEGEKEKLKAQVQAIREKAAADREARQQKMFMDALESRQKMQTNAMMQAEQVKQSRVQTAAMSEREAMQLMFDKQRGQDDLRRGEESHKQKLAQTKEAAQQKESLKPKPKSGAK